MALGRCDLTDRQVDEHIAVGGVIAGHRSRYAEYILVKKLVVSSNGIGTVPCGSWVKIWNGGVDSGAIFTVHDHYAVFIDHPYFRAQIGGHIF